MNFGTISAELAQNVKKDWQPFVDDMSKALGIKVNAFFASDYAAVIEGMRFNKVQLAWFGKQGSHGSRRPSRWSYLCPYSDSDGPRDDYHPSYHSQRQRHQDALTDVLQNGKKYIFGIGDPNSTSGFLVPAYYVFAMNHIAPKTHFKAVRNAGHEANLLAVLSRQVDVATCRNAVMSALR